MTYDVEYEVFKYICREADSYIPLQKLLKNHGLTFQESVKKAEAYQDYFFKFVSDKLGHHIQNSLKSVK